MIKSPRASQQRDKLWELLKGPVVIVSHKNVDVDGVACMVAFASELKKRGIECQLIAPGDVSKAGESLAKKSGYKIEIDSKAEGNSTLILDVLSPDQLEPYKLENFPKPLIVLDHHYYNPEWDKVDLYYFFDRPSCAEILLDFFKPDKELANVILAGIITDTGMFKHADKKTFQRIVQLLDTGADVTDALKLIEMRTDESEKIAILKAASKLELTRKNGKLIVSTKAGSFESSVASSLIKLGADVAIVAAEKKDFTRISVRSRAVGIHFGKLLEELGKKFGGSGGGHANAAVMEAPGSAVELLNKVKNDIVRRL
jgi:nanoRNase/pAp phosphatase (c-di-AMP/oligoRNAs hydrolase)